MIKSRRMRWAGHVAGMEEMKNAFSILLKHLNGRDHLKDWA
jgi:hypothetical protein